MGALQNYLEVNRAAWNKRASVHFASEFYDVPAFIAGKSSLNSIELGLLGDITGKTLLHLQCHFGQDTISLQRLGAVATGIDLSDESIRLARELAGKTGSDARFVCSDVYALPENLSGEFDWAFSSYGTIGWLPDLKKWAGVIRHFLKPGGKFLLVEFHPQVWMFDDEFSYIQYSYFNTTPIVEEITGTYADRNAPEKYAEISWNHSFQDILKSLLDEGLQLRDFREYNYSPYNCFRKMVEAEPGKFQIQGMEGKLPMVYALTVEKPA